MSEEKIGTVTHYYDNISVAIIKLEKPLKVGDQVRFQGHNDFTQTISSMQVEHSDIQDANVGDEVGVKVDEKLSEGDSVFGVNPS